MLVRLCWFLCPLYTRYKARKISSCVGPSCVVMPREHRASKTGLPASSCAAIKRDRSGYLFKERRAKQKGPSEDTPTVRELAHFVRNQPRKVLSKELLLGCGDCGRDSGDLVSRGFCRLDCMAQPPGGGVEAETINVASTSAPMSRRLLEPALSDQSNRLSALPIVCQEPIRYRSQRSRPGSRCSRKHQLRGMPQRESCPNPCLQ